MAAEKRACVDLTANDPETPKKKAKKQWDQKFKPEYKERFPFVIKSDRDDFTARCTICMSDFSIAHGGENDITKHMKTAKHKKATESSTTNKKMTSFFTKSSDSSTASTRAECLFTTFII